MPPAAGPAGPAARPLWGSVSRLSTPCVGGLFARLPAGLLQAGSEGPAAPGAPALWPGRAGRQRAQSAVVARRAARSVRGRTWQFASLWSPRVPPPPRDRAPHAAPEDAECGRRCAWLSLEKRKMHTAARRPAGGHPAQRRCRRGLTSVRSSDRQPQRSGPCRTGHSCRRGLPWSALVSTVPLLPSAPGARCACRSWPWFRTCCACANTRGGPCERAARASYLTKRCRAAGHSGAVSEAC